MPRRSTNNYAKQNRMKPRTTTPGRCCSYPVRIGERTGTSPCILSVRSTPAAGITAIWYQYNGTSLIYSFGNDTASGAGTIAFSKYSNYDWAPGSSNMLGAAQIGRSQAFVNEFMKQAAIGAAAGVAGRVIGAGFDAFLAARAARTAVDIANLSNKIVRQMASKRLDSPADCRHSPERQGLQCSQ